MLLLILTLLAAGCTALAKRGPAPAEPRKEVRR